MCRAKNFVASQGFDNCNEHLNEGFSYGLESHSATSTSKRGTLNYCMLS